MKNNFYLTAWDLLKNQIQVHFKNEDFYQNYFLKSSFVEFKDEKCIVVVDNFFVKEVLNNDYLNIINQEFSNIINSKAQVIFVLEEELKDKKFSKPQDLNEAFFNSEMSFDNYIVGNFNKDVYMAAKKVITNPLASNLNPLFIYGSTGIGKTHLLNALGVKYREKHPDKVIKYINAEDFLRRAYIALSSGGIETENFKESFSDIDLFLIDDIQFFTNKDKLNEIFFNIFNHLIKNKKNVVLTSDKIPQELKIDSRMISRFNSGLTMKIPKPDIETIKEIAIKKIKEAGLSIPFSSSAIQFIANRFNEDIRILEGILNKIFFHIQTSDFKEKVINEVLVKDILFEEVDNGLVTSGYFVNPNIVIDSICMAYGVNAVQVKSKQRQKLITFVRKVCMFVLREKLNLSYNEIGGLFSNRDHSTVMTSCNFIKKEIQRDTELDVFIKNIINKI